MKKLLAIMCLCCCAVVFGAMQAQAATARLKDSTQMDLTAINTVSGVPVVSVGLIMAWGAGNDPHDAEKWLECDGRTFSAAIYPDLAAIYTNLRVPDYRDQFLRGGGAGQVGQVASDSIRSHAHQMDQHQHTVSGTAGGQSYSAPSGGGGGGMYAEFWGNSLTGLKTSGDIAARPEDYKHVGSNVYIANYADGTGGHLLLPIGGGGSVGSITGGGTITGVTNTAGATSTKNTGGAETAPQHTRVRYLIRALP